MTWSCKEKRYKIVDTPVGFKFNDLRICQALERLIVQDGVSVLLRPTEYGVGVDISYGSVERDRAARDAFDIAEFGFGKNLTEALRFALGAAYHTED